MFSEDSNNKHYKRVILINANPAGGVFQTFIYKFT